MNSNIGDTTITKEIDITIKKLPKFNSWWVNLLIVVLNLTDSINEESIITFNKVIVDNARE